VIATVGDGAMLMNGINEVITIANYWTKSSDPRLIIMVLANRDLNQVTWEERVLAGDPRYECSQTVPQFEFARYAEMLGLIGIRVHKPEQIAPAWEQASALRSRSFLKLSPIRRFQLCRRTSHLSRRKNSLAP
jgi:pyruvate dehydrogenase (quinone)